MEKEQQIFRGQIYYVSFYDSDSHVVKGTRPAVVISNDVHNRFSGTVVVVPITTKRKDYPTHMDIELDSGIYGQILCEQIITVDKSWLGDYKDTLTEDMIKELDRTLCLELQIGGKDAFQYELQLRKVEEAKKNYERELAKLGMFPSEKKQETVEIKREKVEKTLDRSSFIQEYAISKNKTETAKKYGFSSLQAASAYYRRHSQGSKK